MRWQPTKRCLMMLLAISISARPRDGAVTLSMTTTAGEDIGRAARSMVAALNSSLVRVRRAVVDADPARPADAAAVRAHGAALDALVADGALTDVARVDYSAAYTKGNASVFARLFGRPSGPARNRRGRGFLVYLFEIDVCTTPYLLHLDSDTRVWSRGSRDAVRDLVALVQRWPDVLGAALPVHLGTANCTLDAARDREILRRGPELDPRGFVDLRDLSTQFYLLSLRKLQRALPLPYRRANVEDAFSALRSERALVVAAMIPHARPPAYFRGQGRRFSRDVAVVDAGDDVRCGGDWVGRRRRRQHNGT